MEGGMEGSGREREGGREEEREREGERERGERGRERPMKIELKYIIKIQPKDFSFCQVSSFAKEVQ